MASVLNNLGVITRYQGDFVTAQTFYEEALSLYRELGDKWATTMVLSNLGIVAQERGDFEQARRMHTESLARRRELGDKWGIANSLENVGNLAREEGDLEEARRYFQEGLVLAKELGDRRAIAFLLEDFAVLGALEGQAERALCLEEAASALREAIETLIPPAYRAKLDQYVGPLRRTVKADLLLRATAKGRQMGWQEAVDFALGPTVS